MNCRHCGTTLNHCFLDLGFAPPSNAYLTIDDLTKPEITFPLRLRVCESCWLVQTEDYSTPDVFFNSHYAYFSSTSQGWLDHATRYAEAVTERFALNADSFVVEVASNDGYLLRNFVARNIPCLGVEPTASTAEVARKINVPTLSEFFGTALGERLANEGKRADLIIGNNVFAHVPDINDFASGLKSVLKPEGAVTLEFPHVLKMLEQAQFDTVYHEHFSYLSLFSVSRIFEVIGMRVWDVEALPTHGGSLRVYACHDEAHHVRSHRVADVLRQELAAGLQSLSIYAAFQSRTDAIKNNALAFLIEQKRAGKLVAAYGAAAKGNTFLNYAGIKPDLLAFVCDAASAKQNKYLPGSHIPILSPDALISLKPDYIWILPWNIADEVCEQNVIVRSWGAKFATIAPDVRIF